MKIKLIACIGKNRELGYDNKLIWHFREDMKFFKEQTLHKTVVMGRKTWDSLPVKPLPERSNIVLTRSKDVVPYSVVRYSNVIDFLKDYKNTEETCMVIGGASIYEQFLPYADELILTEVNESFPKADCYFPAFSDFHAIQDILKTEHFTIRVYTRNVKETH